MPNRVLIGILSLAIASPALAGGRHGYSDYRSGYNHHRGGYNSYGHSHRHHHGGGTVAALVGGVILGAIIASPKRNSPAVTSAPQVAYAEPEWAPAPSCYERRVTEQTVSGRYVTYNETVCR